MTSVSLVNDFFKVMLGLAALTSPIWGLLLVGFIDEKCPAILNRIFPEGNQ